VIVSDDCGWDIVAGHSDFSLCRNTFTRASFIKRHRTNCSEYYWQPSDEGQSGTAVYISVSIQSLFGLGLRIVKAVRSKLRHTTVGRSPLDYWSDRRTDLYLTTHNTHNRQTSTSQHTTLTTDRPLPHSTQHSQQTDLYLTTHNTHNTQHSQQTDIHAPAAFEPAIPASERPQILALNGAMTGIGLFEADKGENLIQ
jgi:tRNA(Leu) C34 or U34 (ribose-2'-O)-methylase TrmL